MKKIILILLMTLTFAMIMAAQSERSLVREGNQSYKKDKYSDAEVSYRKALEKNKESNQGVFNLGDALYKQERYGEAAEEYRKAAEKQTDPHEKASALHNLGNSFFKEKKYPESITAYKDALKLNPKDEDTKYNLEYAKLMIQLQQQQQQKQKQGQNDIEPSEFAKRLKKQAEELASQRQYQKAYDLMQGGLQKDPTVNAFADFIKRLKNVAESVRGF